MMICCATAKSLIGVWRTCPYLSTGLLSGVIFFNKKHSGKTSKEADRAVSPRWETTTHQQV